MSEDNIPRIRGAASKVDLEYIANHYEDKTPEEIATFLHRSVEFVNKHIRALPSRKVMCEEDEIIEQLLSSTLWKVTKHSLVPSEYEHFQNMWARYIRQFSSGSDIVATDEMAIKDLILMDILATRAANDVADSRAMINQLEGKLELERVKDPSVQDRIAMQSWMEQINQLRPSQNVRGSQQLEYEKRKDAKLTELKATRRARFAEDKESKETFIGKLRQLDEFKNRQREGRLNSKMQLAAAKQKKELGEYTKYEDDSIDCPFLSPEGELEREANDRLQNEQEQTNQ